MRSPRTGPRLGVAVVATLAFTGGATLAVTGAQAAAPGCRVDYRVTNQWSGGFGAEVTATNLGDPLNGWTVTWTYGAGQSVTQAWNATVTQSGSRVTATSVGHNSALGTGAAASFGFNGSWSGSNPAPTTFALNGVTCTGTPGTPAPTTPAPTTPAPSPTTPTSGWNPPAHLVNPLNQVWQHVEQTYHNGNPYGFRNYGWDQVIANRGYLNFCVRWDSGATVTAAQRDQIHATLARQYRKWMDVMVGHNAWPYQQVPIKVVGWAVRDRSQLQWTDTSVDVYVNDIRENAPQCAPACGRFFNQGGQYPNCPGGVARHYDHRQRQLDHRVRRLDVPGLVAASQEPLRLLRPHLAGTGATAGPRRVHSSTHSSRSPGWQSSTRHIASRVLNRTALARPFLSTATFAGVSPTRSANSPTLILRLASWTSMRTTMGIRSPLPCRSAAWWPGAAARAAPPSAAPARRRRSRAGAAGTGLRGRRP